MSRLLTARGEGELVFLVTEGDYVRRCYTTAGVNGKSATDTAIANVADESEGAGKILTLWVAADGYAPFHGTTKVCDAYAGMVADNLTPEEVGL